MTTVYPIPDGKRTTSAAGDSVIHLATRRLYGETYADCGTHTPVYVMMGTRPTVPGPRACDACFYQVAPL